MEIIQCVTCNAELLSKETMEEHSRHRHGRYTEGCPHCGNMFLTSVDRDTHVTEPCRHSPRGRAIARAEAAAVEAAQAEKLEARERLELDLAASGGAVAKVISIFVYPIKSCRGISLSQAPSHFDRVLVGSTMVSCRFRRQGLHSERSSKAHLSGSRASERGVFQGLATDQQFIYGHQCPGNGDIKGLIG